MTSSEIPQEFLDACLSSRGANTVNIARHWQDKTRKSPNIPELSYKRYDDFTDTTSSPYSVSRLEAVSYYAGLPSRPLLVYRTGSTPWEQPTGPEAYTVLMELKPVFSHKIVAVWGELGPKVCSCLDYVRVTWTSIDVVRFADSKNPGPPGPTVIWIGVMPQSLSAKDAHTAALGCLELLESYKITDVDVEFRESVFARSARPQLLESGGEPNFGQGFYFSHPASGVRGPLTPALGLQIASRATPYAEGTGGLYISEGSNSDKIYILSTRHVVFPPSVWNNELYNHMNVISHSREVILPGPKAFQTLLQSTMNKILLHKYTVDYQKRQLTELSNVSRDAEQRTLIERDLKRAEEAIKEINDFHDEVTKYWCEEGQRVLGHIAYSPPITVGTDPENYTEDWALIELDRNKIDWNTFRGNVMDLDPNILFYDVIRRLHPSAEPHSSFKYPIDRLLPLQGIIEEDELRPPQMRDPDGEPYLHVIKSGCATGVTIGRANGAKSFVREYFPDGTHQTSMEWAILPYDQKSRAFSAPGDSGATIVDSKGRIGGLLTGGAGKTEEDPDRTDITYATPFYWLLQRIQAHFPNAHLYERTA